MVNTFLVTYRNDPDFRKSLRVLNTQRLGKQRVEALQILNILEDLRAIAKFYSWDLPPSVTVEEQALSPEKQAAYFLCRGRWVTETSKRYRALKTRLRWKNVSGTKPILEEISLVESKKRRLPAGKSYTIIPVDKKISAKGKTDKSPKKRSSPQVVFQSGGKTQTISRNSIILPEDDVRVITLGFSGHPAVRMWVGYESALKLYINSSIAEFCQRTTKSGRFCISNMKTYVLPVSIPLPWWASYSGVAFSHRASLLRKERGLGRNKKPEPIFMAKQKIDTELLSDIEKTEWYATGYCWPSNLEYAQIVNILKGYRPPAIEVTVKIMD